MPTMEKITERYGVPLVTALVALAVVLYALWGGTVLHSQQYGNSSAAAASAAAQ